MHAKTTQLEDALGELEFRMALTTALLSTLDLDYVLYVISTGITSGDGLGFNRAFVFLDNDDARSLSIRMALGPASGEEAQRIWRELGRERTDFYDLLPRFEAFLQDRAAQELSRKVAAFVTPLHRLEDIAISSHALILHREATLSAVLARCLLNRSPLCLNSMLLREEIGSTGEMIECRHVAMVPLIVDARLIGAIVADNLYTGQAVDSDRLRALHAIGNLGALGIDRARMHARTVAMAEVDGLTGVYNRRYYSDAVRREVDLANRSGKWLSIVVFDLDHFKRYNDAHGHLAGDEILKEVARLLRDNVRGADVVARYGGEEFVVLLRDTPPPAAVAVAEKLRTSVAAMSLSFPQRGGAATPMSENGRAARRLSDGVEQMSGLTLSAGIASSRGGEDPEALFARADRALYQAKEAGRDRVRLAPDLPPRGA